MTSRYSVGLIGRGIANTYKDPLDTESKSDWQLGGNKGMELYTIPA